MVTIRPLEKTDSEEVLSMMRVFYDSPAVLYTAPDEILKKDIEDCLDPENPFIEGWVFEDKGVIAGYSMIAHSYSTEYGGPCLWIEDLYMKPEYRSQGIGTRFFQFIDSTLVPRYRAVRLRLEAEWENEGAIAVYKRCGYNVLPYVQLSKE